MAGVLCIGEISEGKVASITFEALGIGRKLADALGTELSCAILGKGIAGLAQELVYQGADKVYVLEHELLSEYLSDSYVDACEKLLKETSPDIVLLGQTIMGRDLAPRLAFRVGGGLVMDCIELEIDPGTKLLRMTKPVYGGNALAVYTTEAKPQMATVRAKAFEPLPRDEGRKGEVINFDPSLDPSRVRMKVVDRKKEEVVGVKLEDADVVVCGGRGIGGPEGFAQLEELAKLLGGAVGATRPPCDNGWVPPHYQIGLTGKIVTPNLYIGIALSGSSQHLAGMSGSKHIVAINKDPEANIFKVAEFGVVGDYKKVLPAFIQKCKEILEK